MEQYRPAPQFEREVPAAPAAQTELPDLDVMARELDQMKIEARVDAERTRPGLNGFLALLLAGGAMYIAQYVAQYGTDGFSVLTQTQPWDEPRKLIEAGGVGILAAAIVALLSFLAERRTRKAVQNFEQQLVSLGGTPLPER